MSLVTRTLDRLTGGRMTKADFEHRFDRYHATGRSEEGDGEALLAAFLESGGTWLTEASQKVTAAGPVYDFSGAPDTLGLWSEPGAFDRALTELREQGYALLDVRLPDSDGRRAVGLLRAGALHAHVGPRDVARPGRDDHGRLREPAGREVRRHDEGHPQQRHRPLAAARPRPARDRPGLPRLGAHRRHPHRLVLLPGGRRQPRGGAAVPLRPRPHPLAQGLPPAVRPGRRDRCAHVHPGDEQGQGHRRIAAAQGIRAARGRRRRPRSTRARRGRRWRAVGA